MQIRQIIYSEQVSFGNKFKLNENTIKLIEKRTRLSYDEMKSLPFDEVTKLMQKRTPVGEKIKNMVCRINLYFVKIYKKLGRKLGLLENQCNLYTDIH